MQPNTSLLRGADGPDATAPGSERPASLRQAAISVLALEAYRSGVDEAAIRTLFASFAEAGFGLSPEFETQVLAELAALRAS